LPLNFENKFEIKECRYIIKYFDKNQNMEINMKDYVKIELHDVDFSGESGMIGFFEKY
jgi:hypothetical protein